MDLLRKLGYGRFSAGSFFSFCEKQKHSSVLMVAIYVCLINACTVDSIT
jgi:hypothetical protein